MATWTIEVGGTSRPYKSVSFERKLKIKSPTKFKAVIKHYDGIDYFDLVQIKRDGTIEWKGFVETIKIIWDEDGRYLSISGRDTTVILWKKYTENFSNMHKDTAGFFGSVSAVELIKFLLRTPKSDPITEYPYNKEGWGIDATRIADCSATRTSVGDPEWTILRRRGYGWRNTGSPYNTTSLNVNAVESNAWDTAGASPYLDAEDDANYIYSDTIDQEGIFSFPSLGGSPTGINQVTLYVAWKPEWTWFPWENASCEVWISPDAGSTWVYLATFGGRSSPWYSNPWRRWDWDVSLYLDTVTKISNAQVKFICTSSALNTYITHAYLGVSYQTGGEQDLEDIFDIAFDEETVMGIYVESRMDNDSYPRNYKIVTVSQALEDFDTEYAPNEVDPNNHIGYVGDNHIDFDAYNNETAYTYDDFGADYFDEYFKHIIDFKVITDPIPDPAGGNGLMAGVYCLTNALGDLLSIELTGTFINVVVYRDPTDVIAGGAPCLRVGANGNFSYSAEIDEGKTYRVQIKRIGDDVTFTVWEDETYFFEATIAGLGATKYRYLLPAVTGNDAEATHTDVDIDNLWFEVETELVSTVSNNTFRDIIHSWTPTTIDNIRIRITTQDASHSWSISQIYIYKAEPCDYRVYKETGCTPTYAADQYIEALSFDSSYATPIGPLNIPKGRLINAINTVMEKCHSAYVIYEWWLALDGDNTFHFKSRKGSDLSGSISFVKGINLKSVDRTKSSVDTVQRIRIMGRGKGKRSEEVSSDWEEDVTAMGNVNTFYEDVVSRKTEVDPDEAGVLAQIFLEGEAEPKDQVIVYVSNDTYASMDYDVGDDVTITDSLSGASGSYRLYNVEKTIDSNGEYITLYVNVPWKTDVDTWANIFNRLKEIEISDSLMADWMGEGVKESKIDIKEATTTSFEKTAKNDTIEAKEQTDPVWWMTPNPDAYTGPVNAVGTGQSVAGFYNYVASGDMRWTFRDNWMEFSGPTVVADSLETLQIELRGETGEEINISLSQNPKLVFELKCVEPPAVTTWFNGDYFDIGMYHSTNSVGYLFRIIRSAAGFTAYARWNVDGNDWQQIQIRTLTVNKKYRFEIIVESEASPKPLVLFHIYELKTETGIEEKLPTSAVALDILTNQTVRPLYTLMSANNNNDANKKAIVYVYRYKTEWEEVQ